LQNNRRQHPRFALDHLAHLVIAGRPVTECRIKNYSEGGLSLQMDAAALAALRLGNADLEDQMVHASVRLLNAYTGIELPFEMPVRIVFTRNQEYGVALMNPSSVVLNYLEEQHAKYAATAVTSTPRSLSQDASALIGQVQTALTGYVSERFPNFSKELISTLFDISEKQPLQTRATYTYAGTRIDQSQDSLKNGLLGATSAAWNKILSSEEGEGPDLDDQQQLELVDQEEFDEWASVTIIARHIEGDLTHSLHFLSQCLAYILRTPVTSDNNPLSPYSLLWALKKALIPLDIHPDARKVAYTIFSEYVIGDLSLLYEQTSALFEKAGVSPDIADTFKADTQAEKETVVEHESDAAVPERRKKKSLVNTLSSLFGKGNREQPQGDASTEASVAAVAQALERMPPAGGKGLAGRIEQNLSDQTGGRGRVSIPSESRQVIDATEQLITVAQEDPRHGELTQALLNQIQVPLAKAAIDNPNALNDADGLSRKVLDDIDQLALLTPATGGGMQVNNANVELQKILSSLEMAGGEADLEHVSGQIEGLLAQRKSDFSSNVQQVQNGCTSDVQAAAYLGELRNFLKEELGASVSSVVDQMLRFGWAGLLADTLAKGGALSKSLKAYKNALVLLNRAYQPENSSATLNDAKFGRLETVLHRGFDSYPLHKHESDALIQQIAQSNAGDTELFARFNQQRIEVTEAYLDGLLPGSRQEVPSGEAVTVGAQWQAETAKLKQGDWIASHQKQGQVRLINLVWLDHEANRYVFVGGSGVKVLDCDKATLAQGLKSGGYSIIEDGRLPMVERAVDKALRHTFERLRDKSDLDELTGLQNRRAHERQLQHLIELSKKEDSAHILICIDLDNFSLVNDLCGYDGGDSLLEGVANICNSYLNNQGMLARTGDSEYRILAEYCSVDEGFRIAENLRKAIENYRFEWNGRKVSVTASIGITEITAIGGHQNYVIQAATLACQQAKKDGRNCTRRYQSDGEVFAQRKRMAKSVPLIEKALERDQLDLHAQLISPIFIGDGHDNHHEILLRCIDEEGKPGSPFEIIEAAERYDRMRSVDRWVVQRFFSWASSAMKNHDAETLGGFSINLSGESMTDETFHEFLLEKVKTSEFPTSQLSFELTETTLVTKVDVAQKLISQLKNLGCTLFLDDFGSGYANYSYLKDFPIDVVKIDGVFVKQIHEDQTSYAMVKSITEVAHHLDKLVVAEFVENEAILNALRKLEVDFAQGYCLGKPAPLDSLLQRQAHVF